MSLSATLTSDEIESLKELTHESDEGRALAVAARDFLRRRRLAELKQASGRFDFVDNWRELESAELKAALPVDGV